MGGVWMPCSEQSPAAALNRPSARVVGQPRCPSGGIFRLLTPGARSLALPARALRSFGSVHASAGSHAGEVVYARTRSLAQTEEPRSSAALLAPAGPGTARRAQPPHRDILQLP